MKKACSCLWAAGPELVLGRLGLSPRAQEAGGDAISQTAWGKMTEHCPLSSPWW